MPPADDVRARVRAGAAGRVAALDLRSDDPAWGVTPQNVYVEPLERPGNRSLPCVVLTAKGEAEQKLPGSTEHRDWLYPLRLLLLDDSAGRGEARDAWRDSWRKALIDAFEDRRLPGVPEVQTCRVEFLPLTERDHAGDVVSALRLRFWVREPREEG
jgi:hypothetical protein